MADQYVSERFKFAVRNHRMTIEQDFGVFRSLYFAAPGTGIYSFRLVTWPGHLAISGDLDDFTFCRLRDMFDFFRFAGPEYDKSDGPNYGYWEEKAQAVYKHGGTRSFSEEMYEACIKSDFDQHVEHMTDSQRTSARADAEVEGLFEPPHDARDAVQKAQDWRCPITDEYPFTEFYEHRLEDYSFGFKFACHAIQWGIKQYDLHQQGRDQASHDKLILSGAA